MIEINNLTYRYQIESDEDGSIEYNYALKNLDLEVKNGDFVAILGHNGSGKSTLAKLLNAQMAPTEGKIIIDGFDSSVEENVRKIRKRCSMVFQNPDNQMVATTVEDEVAFGPENLQIENPELSQRVTDSLEMVGMEDYRKRAPSELSGGQKQRVAIAGVVAMMSEYIIFDEPTAMLDPRGRKDVLEIVRRLNKEYGKTILYITHYMEEAVFADKIVVLNSGQKVLEGTPREVFSQVDTMKEMGLTVPQVTEVAYELNKEDGIEINPLPLTIEEFLSEI